jgi:short-subunit dehydrogenase
MKIDGRTALVTGATGGLGDAIARALAERGAELILSGRRADALEPLATELGARTVIADLADRAEVQRLIDETGDIDILVANAALPADGAVLDFSVEQIDRALDVNLRAPIVLARALVEGMTARGSGHIVFISSISGKIATPGSALYSATKYGLRGFASGLRQDLHDTEVGVSTVLPGFIRDAGMFAEADVKLPPGIGTRSPQDVAAAVAHAIERDRAEVDVAPLSLRLGAAFAQLAPGPAAGLSRLLGSDGIAGQIADSPAHRSKR